MRVYRDVLKYYFLRYLNSVHMLIPIVLWFVYQYICYSVKGKTFMNICTSSVRILFVLMVWIAFAYVENIDVLEEDILVLRLNNDNLYYKSRSLFICMIGITLSLTGSLAAFVFSLSGYFTDKVTAQNLLLCFISLLLASVLGGAIGLLFDARYFQNKKMAVSLMSLLVIVSLAKEGILYQYKNLAYILYVLPPIYEIAKNISNNCFNLGKTAVLAFYVLGYSFVLYLIGKVIIIKRRQKS